MVATVTRGAGPVGAPGAPLLKARGLYVAYGDLHVLNGVDFEVGAGQLVALAGENGAGKSTLVRCIAGDILPDAGDVLVNGARVRSHGNAAAAGLAVVWQDAALCDNLDVASNLFLGREMGRWFTSDARATVAANAIVASYGIRVDSSRPVRSLSAGQRQLIAVARAMQSRPRLLVLDEPTASLGVHETRQVEELIMKLNAGGTTILLVSHDVDQVFHMADRILVLHRGLVAADLAPSETHPEDVVAIMSGHTLDDSARHQLTRLQTLVDQLASAKPNSSLPLVLSALASALSIEQLCIHLLDERSLRLVASTGFPSPILLAWASLPVGAEGGPMGMVAETGRNVLDEDIDASAPWSRFAALGRSAGVRSSWSVPLIGQTGLIGVITGCQPFAGRPQRDQMDLVSLYAGYAAGAIERDRLFGEVTARNRVLETIREVLETLAGPEQVAKGLLQALQSLHRGLRAEEIELWLRTTAGPPRCAAYVDSANQPHWEPPRRDASAAIRAFSGPAPVFSPRTLSTGPAGDVVATTFDAPGGRATLIGRWTGAALPDDALALLSDGAHSVRLALERDEAEQAHQQAAALRRSHQLQRDFLSRLSHELRTPLTAIRGYASSLLAPDVTWDDESKLRFLNRIAGESARLGRLVGDLLDFSAIEAGLLRLQPDWCDLALVLEAAVSCLPPGREKAVSVDCALSLGPVWADHDRLEQVFVNLLDNALRHNDAGVRVHVTVSAGSDDTVAIRVADDGRGIAPELRALLFDSQARGPTSATGAGLGLSIARGIVTAHGGHIGLEGSERGACFLIVLPVEGPGENVA
ncbi:MAG TPA: ATP-binding cassette domain-containing protein [Acidimicrobiales bacterium]|nr:ATP-binding cassette domain-containing protein [Acidimicrobiales bacterium]